MKRASARCRALHWPSVPLATGNRPPAINSSPRGPAARNLPYRYPVEAKDPDGDALTYALDAQSQARGMSISADGVLEWLPTAAGDYPITVTARDVHGAAAEQRFTLTVLSNAPPQITSTPPVRLDLGQTLNYTVTAIDPNPGDTLSYSTDAPAVHRSAYKRASSPGDQPLRDVILLSLRHR